MNLKDLSELLGLSQTTVSRALNGYPEVKESTRKRVRQAALDHNYSPNAKARSLATGQAMAIGLVIPMVARHETVNPVFSDFVSGVSEVLASFGYNIVLSLAPENKLSEIYRRLASDGRVDGLIIQAPMVSDWRIDMLQDLGLPYVVHGRISETDQTYSWLDMDNRRAFHRATEYLIAQGHHRIALLNGVAGMDFAYRRQEGFCDALREAGLHHDPELIANDVMTETYGYDSAASLLSLPSPPTAFLTSSQLVAMGVRRAIENRGLQMGRDVSVMTHDDDLSYLPNGFETPIFTATHSSVRDAGMRIAEMLLALINDPGCAPLQTRLEASLHIGPSTGPGPESSSLPLSRHAI